MITTSEIYVFPEVKRQYNVKCDVCIKKTLNKWQKNSFANDSVNIKPRDSSIINIL